MTSVLHFHKRSLVVADDIMKRAIELAGRAAKTMAPVLLCGESGTGKELVARYIHEKGIRSSGPFVSVNCAAVPEGLMEAEFFGYERGAFTGAVTRRIGKFELAQGGTLLLDEISEMSLSLQAKLLRVLQESEIDRLGGKSPIAINCRIIAPTNRDPREMIAEGKFREDLYYRLNVIRVECMPLRGRADAISALAFEFLKKLSNDMGTAIPALTEGALEKLLEYSWPGNVRELRNAIERAIWLSDGAAILPEHLDNLAGSKPLVSNLASASDRLEDIEKDHIVRVLEKSKGSRSRAADSLGITARTLRNKLKEYGD